MTKYQKSLRRLPTADVEGLAQGYARRLAQADVLDVNLAEADAVPLAIKRAQALAEADAVAVVVVAITDAPIHAALGARPA